MHQICCRCKIGIFPAWNYKLKVQLSCKLQHPPEVEQPGEILSRDATLRSQESQESGDSHWSSNTQVRSTRRKLEPPQEPNLDLLNQSLLWANPIQSGIENLASSSTEIPLPREKSMVSDEILLLSRKFEFLNAKLQEQDQIFNQIKGDLRRLYSENQGYHQD